MTAIPRSVALFLAATWMTSCGSPAEQDHVGTYLLDHKAVQQNLEATADTPEAEAYVEQVISMLKDLKGSIELKADGSAIITMSMGDQPEQKTSGTWAREGKHLTIANTGADGNASDASDAKQLLYTGDTLVLNDESGKTATSWIYRREKAKK